MSAREISGGTQSLAPRYHARGLERDSNSLPPSARPVFEGGEILQTAIDVLALSCIALLICCFAAGFGRLGFVLYLRLLAQSI